MISEATLSSLRARLATEMGLSVAGRGWSDFERRLADAARDAGEADVGVYARRVAAGPLAKSEIERLAQFLTVGETYFFRDRAAFDALAERILPNLIRAREMTTRSLRIWSAGCCSGEEPYSLAILLDRLLPDQRGWSIDILGTDVNPQFLAAARRARYGGWSFRGTPGYVRDRWFKPVHGGAVDLLPHIRDRVSLEFSNLAGAHPAGPFDLILCRNVLMYFTPEQAHAVGTRFHGALRDDGLLLVSPAETSSSVFPQFSAVNVGDAVFYSPAAKFAHTPVPVPETMRTAPPTPPISRRTRERPLAPQRPSDSVNHAVQARALANAGRLDDAADACKQAIASDKLSPGLPYLLATIELERDRPEAAVAALRRALFLDPGFVLAHVALADLYFREGRNAHAGRQLKEARVALRNARDDTALPEADGMNVSRVAELLDALDRRLADARHA